MLLYSSPPLFGERIFFSLKLCASFLTFFLKFLLLYIYNEYLFCLNIYEIEVAIPRPPVLLTTACQHHEGV